MQRAVTALTKRFLPDKGGQAVEMALTAKLLIAAAPVLLVVIVVLTMVVALVGALAGESSAAEGGCGTSTAAPVELKGPPKKLIPIYQAASTAAGLNPEGPAMLAGINRVETDFGTDMKTSEAGAIGWMQFEPSTWEEYGDGGNPYNAHDAIFAAARLLKADGAPGNWYKAIFGYNHASWYVEEVEKYAREYATEVPADPSAGGTEASKGESKTAGGSSSTGESEFAAACSQGLTEVPTVPGEKARITEGLASVPTDAPLQVREMIEAGDEIAMEPYVWAGHHALGSPTDGYDCSSAVSYVLYAAGLLPSGTAGFKNGDFFTNFVSGDLVPGGSIGSLQPGPGKWVAIYASTEHTYMAIAGIRFDNSGSETRNGKGKNGANISMWQPLKTFSGFTVSHPTGL